MRDDKFDSLVAEMRAMELWDRGDRVPKNEMEARRLRRLEIFGEIDAILRRQIEVLCVVLRR